jgi:mono/diheme cytochrome c family protein
VRMGQLSDDHISGVIREGRPPRMPGFGEQFLEPSRKVLIAYVRSLSAGEAPAPAPADAEGSP